MEQNGTSLQSSSSREKFRFLTSEWFFSKGNQDEALQREIAEKESKPILTQRFTLDVPPFGVLPLSVGGLALMDYRERKIAASISEDTMRSATSVAVSELPGFDQSVEELWN